MRVSTAVIPIQKHFGAQKLFQTQLTFTVKCCARYVFFIILFPFCNDKHSKALFDGILTDNILANHEHQNEFQEYIGLCNLLSGSVFGMPLWRPDNGPSCFSQCFVGYKG